MTQLMTKLFLGPSDLVQKCISSTFLLDPIEAHQILELVGHKKGPKTPFLWPTNDSFVALTLCDKQMLIKLQKMPKKKTVSKLKFTVQIKLDLGSSYCD